MKYRKNGRTYLLLMVKKLNSIGCGECEIHCPTHEKSKLRMCAIDENGKLRNSIYYWRETLFSKIRNWRRKG